jgi:hypothetical protein
MARCRPERARWVALSLGALALLGLAGCGGSAAGSGGSPSGDADHVVVGPTGHYAAATLEVTSGATAVLVSARSLGGVLYRVDTPVDSGIRPLAQMNGDTVVVGQTATAGKSGVATLDISLARGVRWTINLDGGATTETVDMTAGLVRGLNFGAGVSRATVHLPAAKGTEHLTMAGGASELTISAPPDLPAQVDAVGGASQILLDGVTHNGVAGGSVFQDSGWSTAVNRYSITLTAGVSDFQLTRS